MQTLRIIASAIGYAIAATLCIAAFWALLIMTP
jgi:hypothetical protein